MNQQKKQIIMVVALVVVLAAIVLYQFVLSGPPSTPAKPAVAGGAKAGEPAATPSAPPTSAGKAGQGGPAKKQPEPDIDELLAGIKEVDFDYDREKLPRDPMAPLVGTVSNAKAKEGDENEPSANATLGDVMKKVVSGIVWDSRRPLAIVDNEVVQPGYEYPDGTRIESIEKDRVIFKVGDTLVPVAMKEQ